MLGNYSPIFGESPRVGSLDPYPMGYIIHMFDKWTNDLYYFFLDRLDKIQILKYWSVKRKTHPREWIGT